MTSSASTNSVASMTSTASTASFHKKKSLSLMFSSTLAPKWTFLVSSFGMDHQKLTVLLIFGTLSVGGCGGQGCYFSPNERVIGQIPTTQDSQTTFKPNLTSIFLSARARYFRSKPDGRPCMYILLTRGHPFNPIPTRWGRNEPSHCMSRDSTR